MLSPLQVASTIQVKSTDAILLKSTIHHTACIAHKKMAKRHVCHDTQAYPLLLLAVLSVTLLPLLLCWCLPLMTELALILVSRQVTNLALPSM